MRQYGEVPPWLAALNTPKVSGTSGLGTGGAQVFTPDSGGFGDVLVTAGAGVNQTGGSVSLTFPSTPQTLFISGDEEFGVLTQATFGNVVTITWTTNTLIARTKPYKLHYEWAVSR